MPLSHRRTRRAAVLFGRVRLSSAACVLLAVGGGVAVAAPISPALAAKNFGDRSLRQGDSGSDVRELQRLLVQIGIKTDVDGTFGPGTKKAVKRFQRIARIDDSGAVGRKTISALRRAANGGARDATVGGGFSAAGHSSKSLGDRLPLRAGMSGHDVKVLQDFLNRAGFKVTIDGEFGSGTSSALGDFERANELPVDRIVDGRDVEVLRGKAGAGEVAGEETGTAAAATAEPAPLKLGPGDRATLGSDGLAVAPASAPDAVKKMIAAGNRIAKAKYIYGGGHARFPEDNGYDCSGSMSYVLHKAGLLDAPLVSSDFPNWGVKGPGKWVTLYGNGGHSYMIIAGLRFDTSGMKGDGTRWDKAERPSGGFGVSHPKGL